MKQAELQALANRTLDFLIDFAQINKEKGEILTIKPGVRGALSCIHPHFRASYAGVMDFLPEDTPDRTIEEVFPVIKPEISMNHEEFFNMMRNRMLEYEFVFDFGSNAGKRFTLSYAERFPNSTVIGIDSEAQNARLSSAAKKLGINSIKTIDFYITPEAILPFDGLSEFATYTAFRVPGEASYSVIKKGIKDNVEFIALEPIAFSQHSLENPVHKGLNESKHYIDHILSKINQIRFNQLLNTDLNWMIPKQRMVGIATKQLLLLDWANLMAENGYEVELIRKVNPSEERGNMIDSNHYMLAAKDPEVFYIMLRK